MHSSQTLMQVANLHARNLDQGFLSTLGPKFLFLMYQAIDECEASVLIVENDPSGVSMGFVTGAEGMRPIFRQMLKRLPVLIVALLPSLLNPIKVWRILEILLHSKHSKEIKNLPPYELLSIAVDPYYRGQGVSERLYSGLVSHCHSRGIHSFRIIVGENLHPAHRFYRRMGAHVVGDVQVHGGQNSLVYAQLTG